MKLDFSVEPLVTVWDEMIENAWLHWQETEMCKAGEPFAPLYERYAAYGDMYTVFTVRHDGRLVGHCGMYLVASMHTQRLLATEDTWFLHPDYRKGRIFIDFYKFVENGMRQRGATKITMTAAPYNGACRIMEYLGYKLDCYKYSLDLAAKTRLSSTHGADSAMTSKSVVETENVCTRSS